MRAAQISRLRIVVTDSADQRMLPSSSTSAKVQKQADSHPVTVTCRRGSGGQREYIYDIRLAKPPAPLLNFQLP